VATGLISFRDYMAHKVKEYYAEGFREDFFTAPELDRSFGYAVAQEIYHLVKDYPKPLLLELGAGSGVLAFDILTFYRKNHPDFFQRLTYFIYEFSPYLREVQKGKLRAFEGKVFWCEELFPIDGVVFSNEFFDCLPVHVVKEGKELYLSEGKEEIWAEFCDTRIGDFLERMGYMGLKQTLEVCLDCLDFLEVLSQNLKRGYHLVIDYGYVSRELKRFPKGTLLGYRSHRVADPLEDTNRMDISAYVNFSALEYYGEQMGLKKVYMKSLRDFLVSSPVFMEELERLSLSEDGEDIERFSRLKTMLVSMGDRFKVLLQERL
jgi:SAM-dependent MidA family methyltransferase